MQSLVIEAIDPAHLAEYEGWFGQQSAASFLLKEAHYSNWSGSDARAWVGRADGSVIGVAVVTLDTPHHGHLDLAVKPSERRQGLGGIFMQQLLAEPAVKALAHLQVAVETGNTAGQKLLER